MLEEGSFRARAADFVLMFVFGGFLMTVSFQNIYNIYNLINNDELLAKDEHDTTTMILIVDWLVLC